jgi:hypothetical protein
MFVQALSISIGAGLASAILFALAAKGTAFASLLACLAPLPIMASALGYTHWAGLLAAVVGGLLVSLFAPSALSIGFFMGVGAPAWHLARLAGASRGLDEAPRWTPVSTLALWTIGLAAASAFAWTYMIARVGDGDFEAAIDLLARSLAPNIEALVGPNLPKGVSAHDVAAAVLRSAPIAAASFTVLTLLGNLWLAGRVTAISGLLARPFPDVPAEFGLPKFALGLLAAGLLVAFADGVTGLVGWIVTAAVFTGFTLQGLATAHFLTRSWPQRRTALLALYVVLVVIRWSGALVGLLGVADALFGLRRRAARPPSQI